jgi:hypothetical protein
MYAQNDRGTITGEVKDQAGAVVPGASVIATNTGSGDQSKTLATETGNYTLPSLPAGMYTLTVEVKGFKKFVQQNIEVQVSITSRVDVGLEVGSTTDTVTVTAEAPQLKTESAEQSTIIGTATIDGLPLNFGGGGGSSGNIRSPFAFNMLSPGVTGTGADTSQVNGLPTSTFRIQVEGQDSTSQNDPNWTSTVSHASVDSIEEFSLQTSNFAAEFSQVGGGFYNFTTKSGTNQFHGGGYEYLTNEDLDAIAPTLRLPFPAPTRAAARTISAAPSAARCGFRKSITEGTRHSSSSVKRSSATRPIRMDRAFSRSRRPPCEPATSVPTPSSLDKTSAPIRAATLS